MPVAFGVMAFLIGTSVWFSYFWILDFISTKAAN